MRLILIAIGVVALAACGGNPNVGGTCTATDGCDTDLTCDTTVPGGYCTQTCTMPGLPDECPDGSICDAVAGTAMSCVKICEHAEDCRTDQDCNGITGSNIKACKPKP